jgi:ABC-type branched-subunit amino acid transport system substrate-binding protein
MEIGVYGSFPEKTLDAERLNDLVEQVKTQGAQLVYLVANDPLIAQRLVQVFREQYEETDTPLPILVGQVGAFASQTFMESPEAADVVILRQVWNHDRCPEEITSYYAGQAYGAMYLLDNAIRVADESMPKQGFSLNQATEDTDRLTKFRENVRDALKQTRLDVPCVGMVSFDNTGKNKELHFEFIKVKGNSERIISTDAFLELLKQRILLPPF